jgi:hypothetical protein
LLLVGAGLATRVSAAPGGAPVTDPVYVSWEKACVVHRFSVEKGAWSTFTGPRTLLPLKALPAVGPHFAAALDPMRAYTGWLFDLHTEQWSRVPKSPVPAPLGTMDPIAARFIGDKLVVWGRMNSPGQENVPNGAVLDTATMTWKPVSEAPIVPRYRCASAVVGNRLCVWGGYGPLGPGRSGPLEDGATYDLATDTWDPMPQPPVPGHRYGCAALTWNDQMILFGGRRVGMTYDPAKRRWRTMSEPPVDVGVMSACAVVGDRLFAWSGQSAGARGASTQAAVCDLKTDKWEKLPDAPINPRLLAFAQPQSSGVIVWGGWLENGHPPEFFTDGAAYDFTQRRWSPIAAAPGPVPYELHPGW